jgi:hypothetical protein
MSFKYILFSIAVFLFSIPASYAQQNAVNVDPLTGSVNVGIPIHTVSSGSLSASVNLVYGGNGVKVKDVEGSAGIGWQVTGGGQITRELRGLPDDVRKDNENNNRLGWLYNSNGSKITSFNIANTGTPNCTNEVADTTYLHNNFFDLSDTEPDVFSVNAPGLSCQFVFDNNKITKTIPFRDYKITYDTIAGGRIDKFYVINDQGIKYTFENKENILRQTTNVAGSTTISESNIFYNKWQYSQYKYGINYSRTWYLSNITDANGNALSFAYSLGIEQQSQRPLEYYIGTTTKTVQYWTKEYSTPWILSTISGNSGSVIFGYAENYRTAVPMVRSIMADGVNYGLKYSQVYTAGTNYYRFFLREVNTDQCESPFRYSFTYYGESYNGAGYTTTLSDSTSKGIDFWGYQNSYSNTNLAPNVIINPSNTSYQRYQIKTDNNARTDYTYEVSGADRTVNPATVQAGALNQIAYYNNGTTTLEYEPNDYNDPTGNVTVRGGGIRVKKVTVYDGLNTLRNIVRNYTYTNPATSVTSGKPVTLPVYAFTKAYTGSGTTSAKWQASTVRSDLDLSDDDHSILYSHVTLTQTGAGKTLYEYFLPAMNYDNSATPSCTGCTTPDWTPNLMYVAGPGCFSAGFVSSIITTYPFAPSLNYDFERGLIKKISSYNDDGLQVSESEYTYERTSSPAITTALKFEDDWNVKSYLKYKIYTSTSELSKQVIEKVFDLGSTTLSQQTSVNYSYNGANHELPTLIQNTRSDGTVENNHIKYSKDYAATSTGDPQVIALYNLQQKNINVPIEQYTVVSKGGTDKVTTAQLIKYKPFSLSSTLYLPTQTLRFFDQNGMSGSSFVPSTITAGAFVNDSKYIIQENDVIYDNYGFLLTSNDNRKRVQTVLSDLKTHLPVVVAANTSADEIAYYAFSDSVGTYGFVKTSGTVNSTTGRASQINSKAASLTAGTTFSRTVTKNTNAVNYIFSIWINSSSSGNIGIGVPGNTYTIPFTNTSGVWKYFETKIPVSALLSTFTVTFQNAAAGAVTIDDVLFYPENAEVTTYAYDAVTKARTIETNTNGVSNYFTSDGFGRLKLVLDQDKNIKQRQSYNYSATPVFYNPVFSSDDNSLANPGTLITFSPAVTYNECDFVGVTYTWIYGDGDSTVVLTSDKRTHTYASTGTYNVVLKVYIPGYGTKTVSMPVTIYPPPPPPPSVIDIRYVNNSTTGGALDKVTFSQSGLVKYTFTGATLALGTTKIPAGLWNINAFKSGTVGSITISTQTYSTSNCVDQPLPTGKYATVVVSVSNPDTITLTVNDATCN